MSVLKDLLYNKDISIQKLQSLEVEVGMVEFKFKEDINKIPNKYSKIANVELDIIAIEKSTNEIIVLDHDQTDFVMQYAAQNLQNFIKALACIEDFFDKCEENQDLYNDFDKMEQVSVKASIQAGGERYLDFYKCMFGI